MDIWNKAMLKSLLIPSGLLLLVATVLLESGLLPISASAVTFYYYGVFGAGILVAWRFHSSRVLFALITLLLAHRAVEFFSAAPMVSTGPGRIAFEATAFLLPLNFIVLAFIRERGLAVPAIASRAVLLFVQSVFVAVICRPGEVDGPAFLHFAFVDQHLFSWTRIPQISLLAFAGAFAVLLVRFLIYGKPVEGGLLWALVATLLAFHSGGVGRIASAYLATAGLILASSIIENSYVLAYHDELTALPARRAFNDALFRLESPYAIAVVDIDHFKNFNDTYGHDTGDQVLRLVADRLARVTGGGHAFRVGGEEFSILFPAKSMTETVGHLETLRTSIAETVFRVRGSQERRRTTPRGPDRRTASRRKSSRSRRAPAQTGDLSVTVSIGVAEPTSRTRAVEQVIQAADKALYRAKQAGRNRTETATAPKPSRLKRRIA